MVPEVPEVLIRWSHWTVMESTESRFAHLLQPIRELTRNWDIDVASELNDYLEEVSRSPGGAEGELRWS